MEASQGKYSLEDVYDEALSGKIAMPILWKTIPIFIILLPLFSYAQSMRGDDLIGKIQGQYEITRDLVAEFEQKTHVKMLDKVQRAEGTVYLKRPGKMRWEYRGQQKKEIIINGNRMWTHDPLQKQVTVTDLSKVSSSNTFMTFLTGMGDLRRDFRLEDEGPISISEDGFYHLRLIPKDPKTPFSKLTLFVDSKSFQIRGTSFLGLQGDLTVIIYKNIVLNKGLSDTIFHFQIPEGTEVLHYPPAEER